MTYNQDGIITRPSTIEDVEFLSTRLKDADIREVWSSHHYTPHEALTISMEKSIICLTISNKGVPLGMFGITAETYLSDVGLIWLLTSDDINKIKIRFLRRSKDFVDLMLGRFSVLYNFTSADHTESIGWLRHIGADMGEPMKYGVEQKMFIPFKFEGK